MSKLELFDNEVTRYDKVRVARGRPAMDDDIKIGIVVKNLEDGPLKVHLLLNLERVATWDAFRADIVDFRRAQDTASGPAPMDVGMLGGRPGKGGGRGNKGGGATGSAAKTCFYCGKPNHVKSECRKFLADKAAGKAIRL